MAAILAVAAAIAAALFVARSRPTPAVNAGAAALSTPLRPSTDLVILEGDRLRIANADAGSTVRSVRLSGPTGPSGGPLTVTANGRLVYDEIGAPLCRNSSSATISTINGRETTVVPHALNAALSPNGRLLAYTDAIAPPTRFGEPQS